MQGQANLSSISNSDYTMKKILYFISICLLFASPIVLYYTVKTVYLLKNDQYKETIYGNEIYHAIEKSKKKTKYKKLILGDSTANQFYNCKEEDPDSAYSLSCNQAIGMIGQYILLNNYIKAGNRPDTVYLVYTPFSFWDNLDQVYTYHYFLKPFYYDEYKPLMSGTVKEQIRKIPKYQLCHIPYIQTTGWAPNIKQEKRNYSFLSPISKEYLSKFDSLSNKYNFTFRIIPTFVAEHWRDSIKHFRHNEYADCCFKREISNFLKSIPYLADSCFVDEVHLKTPKLYQAIINQKLHLN